MKKLMMLSAVAALMLGGSAIAAGPETTTVQVNAPSSYKLSPDEFQAYAYGYRLDDGNLIRFTQSGRKYWARMNNGDRIELYAAQPGVFMTAGGARIEFREQGDLLVINNYERLPLAMAPQGVNVRMVAER